jgi:hypothetical protein
MHRGYVKLWRRLKDSDFWQSEKFSGPQAWVDLLMLANHKDTFFKARGQRIEVKRGQVAYSEVTLSNRWKWSRGKTRRFLQELSSKTVQQIVQQKNNLTTLITILNWEQYQVDGTALGTPDGTPDSTPDGTHLKNVKNVKKKRRESGKSNGIPDWISKDLWTDFKEFRIRIKAPLTDRATKNIISELEKFRNEGQDPEAIINQSITRGWRGVFKIKGGGDDCPGFDWSKP